MSEQIKELIEKQISDARGMLEQASENRDVFQAMGALMCMGERLLQIVQNQQAQIEELQQARRAACGHRYVQGDRCADCGAPWLEVKQ